MITTTKKVPEITHYPKWRGYDQFVENENKKKVIKKWKERGYTQAQIYALIDEVFDGIL